MKNTITLIALLITSFLFSQSGINYKAIIKDGSGNILASQSVDIQFIIYEGVALTNNVYQESHTSNTDANGIIIVNIGEGTTVDVFADVAWGNDEHWLNVQVDTGVGLVDMGTTQFMTVPYALHAANVSGLEKITENDGMLNNTGWRLKGVDPANYGPIGNRAVDLSTNQSNPSTTYGATGSFSFASGLANTASGFESIAMGAFTIASERNSISMGFAANASADFSTAMGYFATASAGYSTAMGYEATAQGVFSTAIGFKTKAFSYAETVMGTFNTNYTPLSTTAWRNSDRLFVIGNGNSAGSGESDALSILKNGTITAPSFDISEITNNKALITKEYMDANGATGLETINEGNGIGYRLIGKNPSNYGPIGLGAIDFSSSNSSSSIRGATEEGAFCFGNNTISAGFNSFAGGSFSVADGNDSLAFGFFARTNGRYSTAIGYETKADARNSFAIGRFNTGGGNTETWVTTDPLFEIGNGASSGTRNNALTVLKNGRIGIGTSNPQELLHLNGTLRIGDETIRDAGNNALRINAALLPDLDNVNVLGNPTQRWTTVYATNGTINTSDRREKKNIKGLAYGLAEVLQMQPVSFNWKNENNPDLKLGLIAQDLQTLIPEVVKSHIWEKDEVSGGLAKKELERLGVYYSDLVPVLIKAIQEQQSIIIDQKIELASQTSEIEVLSEAISEIEQLSQRINQLEANQKNLQK